MRDSRKHNANLGSDVVLARDGEDDEKARGVTKTRSSVRPLASLGARDENGQEPVS